MLSGKAAAAGLGLVLLLAVPAEPAAADGGGVTCPQTKLNCDVTATQPGTGQSSKPGRQPASSGKAAGKPRCVLAGKPVPCSTPDMGTFNAADACYWEPIKDPEPLDWKVAIGLPDGWKPGDPGKLYNVTCPGSIADLQRGGVTYARTAPGGGVDVQALAREAVKKLPLRGPDIGIAPRPDGTGVVGMPVWMWNKPGPSRTGPATASASTGGVTVSAIARVARVVWDMGDGGHPVTCTAPGTPYDASYGLKTSPDCGYRYTRPSTTAAGDRYPVTATTTWNITWTGAGQSGTLTATRRSASSVRVHEVQVVN
ncbi:ATP/GTP-binding protein [Streptomyces sp. 8L]|uniref:ATP/GTP-binding protein n=1 Tax=Streptomyces sp. 8L TaxID=2877242 RepID=UPI001CD5F91A|nr:ATP/GTP-binding protein [Streptomyces sp. 8L]MCA1224237.1 ATP/GTP-binding protein [Streptomyces sp. 8L]